MKRIIRARIRRKVIVTLKTGEAVGGVLFEPDSEAIVVKNAVMLDASATDRAAVPVDGEFVARWDNIAYLQFP